MPDVEEAFQKAKDNSTKQDNSFQDKITAMADFFKEDTIDQVAILSKENEAAIITENAINDFYDRWLGFHDEVSEALIERKMAVSPSREGEGRKNFVQILQGAKLDEDQKDDLNKRLVRP